MRVLKLLIGVMTVLIVIGLILISWRIATLGGGPVGETIARTLDVAPGCDIAAASTSDGLTTIVVNGTAGCNAVYVIELATGEIRARIDAR